jgi:hypothetical protein
MTANAKNREHKVAIDMRVTDALRTIEDAMNKDWWWGDRLLKEISERREIYEGLAKRRMPTGRTPKSARRAAVHAARQLLIDFGEEKPKGGDGGNWHMLAEILYRPKRGESLWQDVRDYGKHGDLLFP